MKINRRRFLKSSALGLGVLAGTSPRVWSAESATTTGGRLSAFDTVTLGSTGIKTSRVSMGTGVRGGPRESNLTRMGADKAVRLIRDIHEKGVRSFDLADLYGTHPFIPVALDGVPRDQYMLISKVWFREGGIPEKERPRADLVVERFLKELKTDYIDLVLLHCAVSPTWNREQEAHMEALANLKKKGVIRAHGVSCHSLEALRACIDEPWVDSVHARINPFQMVMDGPVEEVAPVLKQIRARGKGVVGMKIIGEGRLSRPEHEERKDQSIRYAWENDLVDMVTVGFEEPWHVDDFATRIAKVPARKAA